MNYRRALSFTSLIAGCLILSSLAISGCNSADDTNKTSSNETSNPSRAMHGTPPPNFDVKSAEAGQQAAQKGAEAERLRAQGGNK